MHGKQTPTVLGWSPRNCVTACRDLAQVMLPSPGKFALPVSRESVAHNHRRKATGAWRLPPTLPGKGDYLESARSLGFANQMSHSLLPLVIRALFQKVRGVRYPCSTGSSKRLPPTTSSSFSTTTFHSHIVLTCFSSNEVAIYYISVKQQSVVLFQTRPAPTTTTTTTPMTVLEDVCNISSLNTPPKESMYIPNRRLEPLSLSSAAAGLEAAEMNTQISCRCFRRRCRR